MSISKLIVTVLVGMLAIGSMRVWAQGADETPQQQVYTIPAGDLNAALKEFARQSHLQISYSPKLVRGKHTPGLSGTYAPADALKVLLSGTVLTATAANASTYVLKALPAPNSSAAGPTEGSERVLVAGARLNTYEAGGNVDIPRTIDDAQPYYIFDSATIEQSGAVNLEDFLKQRLTMNTVAQTNGQVSGSAGPSPGNNFGNTSTINLRGLGTDKTLILVDGRRMPGVNIASSTDNQPDLNGIPLSAVDRIEVLPSSASGIYGGSAIGGVINIILKKNYTGGQVQATYDGTWDRSDDAQRTIAASYGTALEGGKTHVTVNASLSSGTPLLFGDRAAIFEDNLATIQSHDPTFFTGGGQPFLGALPNIENYAGTNNGNNAATFTPNPLVLKGTNTVLPSGITYVPAGTSPTTNAATLASGLLKNAGSFDFGLPDTAQSPTGLKEPFGVTPETRSLLVSVSREMLPYLTLFTDLSFTDNRSRSAYGDPSFALLYVPTAAPTNPFTTDVFIRAPTATEDSNTTRSQNRAATLGALLQLPHEWTGEADYTWSENLFNYLFNDVDASAFFGDLASGALNPFVDTLRYPLNLQRYLGQTSYQGSNRLSDTAARASGPLLALPWGTPHLTVGLEHRVALTPERTVEETYPITVTGDESLSYYERHSTTDSGYLEATAPLIKEDWLPGVHALELQASGRIERYRVDTGTVGSEDLYNQTPPAIFYIGPTLNGQPYFSETTYTSTDHTLGLKYQPLKELTLRVSRATAFLPPTPDQLIKNPLPDSFPTLVNDPKTGQTNVSVETLSGGNPNLTPQTSRSLDAGIIWEPRWRGLEGLRLDAEYYKIEQFNAISALDAQQIVDAESLFPGRVTRNSSGTITEVDISDVNLFHLDTEGWDLSADDSVSTPVGRFSVHAVESIITHLRTQYAQNLPDYEAAGYSPEEGGAPKYKSNATLTWAWREWTAGWSVRYFGSYKQNGAAGGPSSVQYNNGAGDNGPGSYIFAQGSDTIPSQMYHDLFVSYAVGSQAGARLLRGLTVQLGVRNVFDKVPPLDVSYANNLYLSPYGDARLRSYWLTAREAF